ncbi:MAG: hypothetical protein HYT30_01655 [Parcubacteria group bacterium]|nr:hypothetical protein [Parcubacteria group bacterium]
MVLYIKVDDTILEDILAALESIGNFEWETPSTEAEKLAYVINTITELDFGSYDGVLWTEYEGEIDISPITTFCDQHGFSWHTEKA